jgi:hypothetical protein
MTAPSATKLPRISALDHARSIAILLAVASHSMLRFDAVDYVFGGVIWDIWYILVRVAPPIFILLFGSLLEIIYTSAARAGGLRRPATRLMQRAIQCYLLFLATLSVAVLTGEISAGYFITNALFMGVTSFVDILKFYAVMCAVAPLLIWVRIRYGFAPLIIAVVAIQLLQQFIFHLPSPPQLFGRDGPARMASFFLGIGDYVGGPSVLQGSFFVVMGMLLGNIVGRSARGDGPPSPLPQLALMAVALGVAAITAAPFFDPAVTLASFTSMDLRNANHPFYFMTGSLGAVLLVMATTVANHRERPGYPLRLSMIGQQSLFAFSVGNAIIYLMPPGERGPTVSLLLAAFTFVLIYAATALYDRLTQSSAKTSQSLLIRLLSRRLTALLITLNKPIRLMAEAIVERLTMISSSLVARTVS